MSWHQSAEGFEPQASDQKLLQHHRTISETGRTPLRSIAHPELLSHFPRFAENVRVFPTMPPTPQELSLLLHPLVPESITHNTRVSFSPSARIPLSSLRQGPHLTFPDIIEHPLHLRPRPWNQRWDPGPRVHKRLPLLHPWQPRCELLNTSSTGGWTAGQIFRREWRQRCRWEEGWDGGVEGGMVRRRDVWGGVKWVCVGLGGGGRRDKMK
jgi:hypothetical protein